MFKKNIHGFTLFFFFVYVIEHSVPTDLVKEKVNKYA